MGVKRGRVHISKERGDEKERRGWYTIPHYVNLGMEAAVSIESANLQVVKHHIEIQHVFLNFMVLLRSIDFVIPWQT